MEETKMANYEEFRKKAKDALDTLADVSVEAYKLAEEKTRVLAKRAKLTAAIANERASVRRLKVEIGGTYYKLHKDAPDDALKQLCEEVTFALDSIAAKQRELEELRNCRSCETEGEAGEECKEGEECACGCEEPAAEPVAEEPAEETAEEPAEETAEETAEEPAAEPAEEE